MELFLQMGHGMKSISIDLAKKWGRATVILSPRDIAENRLPAWTKEFSAAKVQCLFDPQMFFPKGDADKNLLQYSYFDRHFNTYIDQKQSADTLVQELRKYNDIASTAVNILPANYLEYDEQWEKKYLQRLNIIVSSAQKYLGDKPLYATLMLPAELLLQSGDVIDSFLTRLEDVPVDGYYVLAHAIRKDYLIDSPVWLYNVLNICASLHTRGKKVVFGYGNHQMLPLALAGVDAMASGTWLNVRSFTNRFVADEDEFKRRTTWAYFPKTMSEYKISFLDWAVAQNVFFDMASDDEAYQDEWIQKIVNAVDSGDAPSTANFNETDAFKHYLCCLRHQAELLNRASWDEAYSTYEMMLNTAETNIAALEKAGVYGQTRSFRDFIDVNRAAVFRLKQDYGLAMKMGWKK